MLLSKIVICAALLVPAAAFAADQTTEDPAQGPDKSICDFIRPLDPLNQDDVLRAAYRCGQSPMCKWDDDDRRCEPFDGHGFCYHVGDPSTCNATPGCVWDLGEQPAPRCEPLQ
jgi:hypothetical protein